MINKLAISVDKSVQLQQKVVPLSFVSIIVITVLFRGQNSSLVVCWARCPVWCNIVGGFDPPLRRIFPAEGILPLELTWVLTPFSKKLFWIKPRSSLYTHAFNHTHSKDPDIHVLGRWMPATKTHQACTMHKDGMWLPQWLDLKNGHIRKNLIQKGKPQRYSWGMQKKKKNCFVFCLFLLFWVFFLLFTVWAACSVPQWPVRWDNCANCKRDWSCRANSIC